MSKDLILTDTVLSELFVRMVVEAMRIESSKPTMVRPNTSKVCIDAIQCVKEAFNAELRVDID